MMSDSGGAADRCSGCGLPVADGNAGCQAIFDALLARDFSDVSYFRVHRMMVDTYCLQHPEKYCASAKSLAAHLMGLCWLLEHDGNRAVGSDPLRRWLDGNPQLEKPAIPPFRGKVTVAALQDSENPMGYARAVETWARSTWEAYSPLQATARRWIQQAMAGKKLPRR